jgi:hypothetical protein
LGPTSQEQTQTQTQRNNTTVVKGESEAGGWTESGAEHRRAGPQNAAGDAEFCPALVTGPCFSRVPSIGRGTSRPTRIDAIDAYSDRKACPVSDVPDLVHFRQP